MRGGRWARGRDARGALGRGHSAAATPAWGQPGTGPPAGATDPPVAGGPPVHGRLLAARRGAAGLEAATPLLMLAGITLGALALLPFAAGAVLRINLR